jgi:hypothetical protein
VGKRGENTNQMLKGDVDHNEKSEGGELKTKSKDKDKLLEKPNLYVIARFLEVLYKNRLPMKKTTCRCSFV